MTSSRDLLVLCLALALVAESRPRAPPSVGLPRPPPFCPVVVEAAGAGVGCLSIEEAGRAALRPGDRLRLDGARVRRERMAPASQAAWRVPVDLNRASPGELAALDGVGPRLAERIAAARPFATIDELVRVGGLGRHRLARLRDRLTVTIDPEKNRIEREANRVDP